MATLEAAVAAAKHSLAGAPGEMTEREFLEALLYLHRTGTRGGTCPELGYWHAVYMRFRRWEARGVWERLQNLQAEPFANARAMLTDSTTVRAHPHAAGAPKKTLGIRLWAACAAASPPKSTRRRSTKNCAGALP